LRDLEEQRALPDPGLAADEDHGSRHDAAAQDAVELADPEGMRSASATSTTS
jgi:hypothetical protein